MTIEDHAPSDVRSAKACDEGDVDSNTLEAYSYHDWSVRLTIEDDDFFGPPTFVFYLDVHKGGQPVGRIDVIATLEVRGEELWLSDAHIHGLERGKLGRDGLNALAQAIKESAGAESIVIEGGARTTGARPGHTPKRFRYPSRPDAVPGGTG